MFRRCNSFPSIRAHDGGPAAFQRGCFRWGNLTFRALLVRGWREKKWVYTLVVLRGSTVPHFIWAHPANAHIGGPEQLGRRRDGEWQPGSQWMLFVHRLPTFYYKSTQERAAQTDRGAIRMLLDRSNGFARFLVWLYSCIADRTGVRTEGKKKPTLAHICLHKMPGFGSSYSVQFKSGCSFGRTPDLQPLKAASSVQ